MHRSGRKRKFDNRILYFADPRLGTFCGRADRLFAADSKVVLDCVIFFPRARPLFCCPVGALAPKKPIKNGGTGIELLLPFFGSLGLYPFPGFVVIPVIAGSLLLLRYGATGPVSQILCNPLFVGIGKISYSLYLWHWPIIVFARYMAYDHQSGVALNRRFFIITSGSLSFLAMGGDAGTRFQALHAPFCVCLHRLWLHLFGIHLSFAGLYGTGCGISFTPRPILLQFRHPPFCSTLKNSSRLRRSIFQPILWLMKPIPSA